MSTTTGLKALHDRLMAHRPDGADHDEENCSFCREGVTDSTTTGGPMPETFTQGDIDAAVTAATDSLQKRLSELESQAQETEVGRAVAEATATKDTEISTLQQQLDTATAERTAVESKLTETETFWTDAITAQQAAVELAQRREKRMAEAKAAGVFDEDYLTKNADRFAAMSDDDFAARLDEWRLIAAKSGSGTSQPVQTALVASATNETPSQSGLSLIPEMRLSGVDPRTLTGGF